MGGLNQNYKSIDHSKILTFKEAKSDIIDKQMKKKPAKKDSTGPDVNSTIFNTIFPPLRKKTEVVTMKKINKSFEYSSNPFERDDISNILRHSFYSVINDNESEKSDLINIDESSMTCIMKLRKLENRRNTGQKLRMDYLAKLVTKKVWCPTKQVRNHNTIFFFDWDDTLMCTSFLTPTGQFSDEIKINDKDREKIRNLDLTVSIIMQKTTRLGDVFIVTNAAPGWVEFSSKKFYPETSKHLSKATIISARGTFEKKYPGNTKQWKVMAFLDVLNNLNTKLITNLICLGDSIIEIEAAHILASKFSHSYIKTVKFKENPNTIDLNKQLSLIIAQLDKIYSSVKNLNIRVERKKNE